MSELNDYVTIRVLFFARAREFTGEKEVSVNVPSIIKGNELLNFIAEKYNLKQLKCNVILALNESWMDLRDDLILKNADEVAVIPPLSGEYGAISLFIGTTRNNFQGKIVSRLEYEAYEGMAIKSLENICENIRKKFDVGNIAIYHRLGDVPVQEASVIIAISSAHRKSALGAVPYAIDALKADTPIWKKEVYEDGKTCEWKENSEFENGIPSVNADLVQLYEEVVEAESENEVPSHLIQINANLKEIDRRINSFINRKREQINVCNVQDFCLKGSGNADESTCARVSAVLKRRKDSKSHLKVHRVENCVGPQTQVYEPGCHSSRECLTATPHCPPGAEERLANAENYLKVNQTSRDVFSRLKAIEDKILYLESISPEYFDFDKDEKPKRKSVNYHCKKTYTFSELDLKMQRLEAKLQKRPTYN